MNVLIVGSGAREHAIARALVASKQQPRLFCYGLTRNPGIEALVSEYELGSFCNVNAIVRFATRFDIQLAIIGSEAPLQAGVADALWSANIPTIGPKRALALIETSKSFARDLMKKYQIPGRPRYASFDCLDERLTAFIRGFKPQGYVIKADGLMGGKGVKVAGEHIHSEADALSYCEVILAHGQNILIEEKLIGQEFSLMCFSDGQTLIPMPLVQDHKRAYVGDKGPNTGGMGSYSLSNHRLPFLSESEYKQALHINQAVLEALKQEFKDPYIGVLYGSFIATRKGVFVIEFNARFGDPEAMNVLPILESDFLTLCQAMIAGCLEPEHAIFAHKATVCKYLVPDGYPEAPRKGFLLDFSTIPNAETLYFSSVHREGNQLFAAGSRTAAFVGIADTLTAAEQRAEQAISSVQGPLFYRKDIGTDALVEARIAQMQAIHA